MSVRDNHWRVFRKLFVAWKARVPIRADAPEELLWWIIEIIAAAERLEVARFLKEDRSYWHRDELGAWLERRLQDDRVVDVFKFAKFGSIGTKLAYFGPSGVDEEEVYDTGRLLHRLRPEASEYTYVDRGSSPLLFDGNAINFDPDKKVPLSAANLPSISVRVGFQTDIWFPWVPGEDLRPQRELFYDNRPLAERHTARLNAFLRWLRESALVRGGAWELIPYSESKWVEAMIGPDGIDLDAEAPPMSANLYSRDDTQ